MQRCQLIAALTLCAACGDPGEPSPPALHDVIVYVGPNQYGTVRPWVMALDGTGRLELPLPGGGVILRPDASRDGEWIVVQWSDNLYVSRVDGTEWRAVFMDPTPDLDPVFSPDGSRIAFISFRDADWELYAVNVDGSEPVRLTSTPGVTESYPSWSPDGTWIVYAADDPGAPGPTAVSHLYKVRSDGSGSPIPLTTGSANDIEPAWSPLDDRILFSSNRNGPGAIFLTDASGAEPVHVPIDYVNPMGFPSWSPDATELLLNCFTQICRAGVDGSNLQFVTDGSFNAQRPQWVP